MKKSFLINLIALFPFITSCVGMVTYGVDSYSFDLEFKDGFNICQLNDIHISTSSNLDLEFAYLTKVIESQALLNKTPDDRPDLLVLNGDNFMDANKEIVDRFFDYFEGLKIPYCFLYGNHDLQGSYKPNYISNKLLERRYPEKGYAIYSEPENDDVYGRSNYFVNLKKDGKNQFQIYLFDSNSYVIGDYDIIHDDQVNWYERMLKDSNEGQEIPKSLAFMHIPFTEFQDAIKEFQDSHESGVIYDEKNYCDVNEYGGYPKAKSKIFDKFQELGSTIGVGVAHNHINNTDLWYKGGYDHPIRLIYGSKSTQSIYHDRNTIGAVFYEIKETPVNQDGDIYYFDLTRINVPYEGESRLLWPLK